MRRIVYSLSLITAMLPALVHAQEPVPLSLEDAVSYAMQHNYTVKNAHLDVKIQKAQNNQVLANAYPKINGTASINDYINAPVTFFPAEFGKFIDPNAVVVPGSFIPISLVPKYANSVGISGSQVIFDGSVLVALQARKAVMELAMQKAEVTKEGVQYNVQRAYNSLVIAYRQFDIIQSSLKYARSIQHDIVATKEAGFAEKIDVERVNVQLNNLATDSLKVASLLDVSAQMLKYQMGMDINTPIVLTDTNIEAHQQHVLQLLEEEEDYTRVPEYNLSLTALKLNEYNVKRYKLAAIPSLAAIANVGYTYSANTFDGLIDVHYPFSSLIGLQLNVPIFNGFMRVNQLKEAKYNVEKSKNDIANAKLGLDFQTSSARTTLKNNMLQAQSQNRNLALANDVLDLAQRKYKAGVGSNLEVTQAQTDQLRAQTNYFNALLDVINAEADLQKALGLLK